MTDVEKRRKTIINIIYFALLGAIILLAIRYALGVCLPFAVAFVFAVLLQKPKNYIVKKTPFKPGIASVICVMGAILVVAAVVSLIGIRLVNEIKSFADYIILRFQDMDSVINNVETWLLNFFASFPEFLRKTLTESVTSIASQLRLALQGQEVEVPAGITESIGSVFSVSWITAPLSGVISTAKLVPSFIVSFVVTIIAACFTTSEYPYIIEFIKYQFPEGRRNDLAKAKNLLKTSLSKMGKAYLLIILITFAEMSLGLTVLRLTGIFESNYIVIIAAITALLDILPVLGAGTILIPWAAYSFITGNIAMGIGLAVMYVIIFVVRQIIEPKLVAGQLGLSPIVTIAALYFGLKLFGVLGMFITPVFVIMLKLLNDEGIINLWKSPEREKNLKK